MRDTPSIESKPPAVRFLTRPLDSHITRTHQRLTDIVEAMVDVRHLGIQQDLLDLLRIVASNRTLQEQEMLPDTSQAVQLVKERDVVDLTS